MSWIYFEKNLVDVNSNHLGPHTVSSVFSKSECKDIIDLNTNNKQKENSKFSWGVESNESRNTDLFWLQPSEQTYWIFDRVSKVVAQANKELYKFNLDGKLNAFQLGRYRVGQGYDWHPDLGSNFESRRKISLSLQLSERDSYDGGELEFYYDYGSMSDSVSDLGSITMFPSWLIHRVNKVKNGTRWSLVNWIEGPPFR